MIAYWVVMVWSDWGLVAALGVLAVAVLFKTRWMAVIALLITLAWFGSLHRHVLSTVHAALQGRAWVAETTISTPGVEVKPTSIHFYSEESMNRSEIMRFVDRFGQLILGGQIAHASLQVRGRDLFRMDLGQGDECDELEISYSSENIANTYSDLASQKEKAGETPARLVPEHGVSEQSENCVILTRQAFADAEVEISLSKKLTEKPASWGNLKAYTVTDLREERVLATLNGAITNNNVLRPVIGNITWQGYWTTEIVLERYFGFGLSVQETD